jgi:hypothetical protein
MAAPAAADEVAAFLNTEIAHRSKSHRYQARMIIVGSTDAAVDADRVARHRLSGVKVGEGTAVPRRQRIAEEDDDESATGFVFVTDEQVRTLAEGRAFPPAPGGRVRVLAGVGIAAWLQRVPVPDFIWDAVQASRTARCAPARRAAGTCPTARPGPGSSR